MARLTTYLDIESCKILRSGFDFKLNLTSAIGYLANRGFEQAMFPVIRPWPMTLAPTNEAVRRDNHAKKKSLFRKKINRLDREVMEDVRTVLPSNTHKVL